MANFSKFRPHPEKSFGIQLQSTVNLLFCQETFFFKPWVITVNCHNVSFNSVKLLRIKV